MEFMILDCTLRDGGYYTNWDFDTELVESYFGAMGKLPVNYVEAGYCNPSKPGYRGEWCYLQLERLSWIKSKLRSDQKLAIMLDAKDCDPAGIPALIGDFTGVVDMVRMAIAPADFPKGLELAREIKKLGFEVGFNTMYLSTYSPTLDELAPLLGHDDDIDVLALVDSFGGCTPGEVSSKIEQARKMFPATAIGFHGHDNTCLGYANALAAISAGAAVIDSTFVGMGRGAGNTRTEMLIVAKSGDGDDLALEATAQVVDRFERLRDIYKWGTNLPYMMSGAANLPQKDVMDWLGKNRYSPVTVIRALQNQSSGSVDTAEYPDLSLNNAADDAGAVSVIIGGGPSVKRHLAAIQRFVRQTQAAVIHANTHFQNLLGTFDTYELLCLPGHAAHQLPADAQVEKLAGAVVPQPPRFNGTVPGDLGCPIFQAAIYDNPGNGQLGPVSDIGPLALAVGAAQALSARKIFLVGFDGYENATVAEQELASEIQATLDRLQAEPNVTVASLTPTRYVLPTYSVYVDAKAIVH